MQFRHHRRRIGLALGLLSYVGLLSCSSDKEEKKPVQAASIKDPCAEELKGQCGKVCAQDGECPAGQFCDSAECRAECTTAGAQCRGTCTGVGRCDGTLVASRDLPSSGSAQSLVGDDQDGLSAVGDNCVEVVFGFEGVTPTVLIVVDRSGSMKQNFDGGRNRWDTVRDTLTGPNGLIKKLEANVRFGLSLYTSDNPGMDATVFNVCPELTNSPITLSSHAAISATFASAEPGNHTPTGESLEAATNTLLAVTEEGPKVIVLATDGDPDNCADGNANGTPVSLGLSVSAVTRAFASGIKTYVISVGDDASRAHLKELAEIGQGKPTADVFSALTTQQLEGAFQTIVGGVRNCSYNLDGMVPEFHAMNGTVKLGAESLTFNDPNGWALVGGNRVEIQGTACQKLLAGDDPVDISFPCVDKLKLPK